MSDLRAALARAAELYDEPDGIRPDDDWQREASDALLAVMEGLRDAPVLSGFLLLPSRWLDSKYTPRPDAQTQPEGGTR